MGGPGAERCASRGGRKGAERTALTRAGRGMVAEPAGYLGGSPSGRKGSGDRRCRRARRRLEAEGQAAATSSSMGHHRDRTAGRRTGHQQRPFTQVAV